MDYPQRFFTRLFAWGRPLELARRFAIYSGVALFLAVCTAGAIVWAHRSQGVRPYFLHVSPESGEWVVYSQNMRNEAASTPWFRLVQESVAVRYAADYFRISADAAENDGLWCRCSADNCAENRDKCAVCCAAGGSEFDNFTARTLPMWRKKIAAGETAALSDVRAAPIGEVSDKGGFWKITGRIASGGITGFARIERSKSDHRQTLGYYIAEFVFYSDK